MARITKDSYEEIRKESEDKQNELMGKLGSLNTAEKEYYMTTARLVDIGSRSYIIFSRSKPLEKRALLNFVLSNVILSSEKVLYTAKYPFSEVLKYGHSPTLLPD